MTPPFMPRLWRNVRVRVHLRFERTTRQGTVNSGRIGKRNGNATSNAKQTRACFGNIPVRWKKAQQENKMSPAIQTFTSVLDF